MKTARELISAAAELTARVQLGKHDFDRRFALFFYYSRGNAASVVGDCDRTVFLYLHENGVAKARHGFVDGVVHDFVDEMVKTALVRGTDIHAGTLSDRFKTFEHLDSALIVLFLSHLFTSLSYKASHA